MTLASDSCIVPIVLPYVRTFFFLIKPIKHFMCIKFSATQGCIKGPWLSNKSLVVQSPPPPPLGHSPSRVFLLLLELLHPSAMDAFSYLSTFLTGFIATSSPDVEADIEFLNQTVSTTATDYPVDEENTGTFGYAFDSVETPTALSHEPRRIAKMPLAYVLLSLSFFSYIRELYEFDGLLNEHENTYEKTFDDTHQKTNGHADEHPRMVLST
ncbi:hypothetical protein DL96DRAFT_1809771 [Flagelloscypha sp. PMI_526]|nr:hypothetical protein DL96DRAFT_1809771 [Flagelloscypha sp. PMI_526]